MIGPAPIDRTPLRRVPRPAAARRRPRGPEADVDHAAERRVGRERGRRRDHVQGRHRPERREPLSGGIGRPRSATRPPSAPARTPSPRSTRRPWRISTRTWRPRSPRSWLPRPGRANAAIKFGAGIAAFYTRHRPGARGNHRLAGRLGRDGRRRRAHARCRFRPEPGRLGGRGRPRAPCMPVSRSSPPAALRRGVQVSRHAAGA